MNNKTPVAKFEKVSELQFCKDMIETFGLKYGCIEDGWLHDIYNEIKLPKRATLGSAGYDIFSPVHVVLEPKRTIAIPTGIRCNISDGYFLAIVPRSGYGFKYGVMLTNTIGIIDSDYFYSDNEGHIFVKLSNESCICRTLDINVGQGLAQGIFLPFGVTVDDDANGIRNGGFGSTGN